MVNDNPYSVIAALKRKRVPSEQVLWLTKIVLVMVVAMLLREPLSIYLLSNTSHRLEQLIFRTGAILVAITALSTYSDVVRHPERNIFGVHPIRARWFLKSVCRHQIESSFLYVIMSLGIWSGVPVAWLGWIAIYILSSWLGGLGMGYAVHLGSVWAATSPKTAVVLDSIRGENPREQAAFIYAPGAALALIGVALIFGAGATRLAIEGRMGFVLWLIVPASLGVLGWVVALKLADRHLIRAGMILSDIDAHWGVAESAVDERGVYLDWLAKKHPHRLRLLRQSWRFHRWVTLGLWLSGCVVSLMLWLGDGLEVAFVSGLVATAFVVFPTRLLQHEPQWLQWSLGIDHRTQWKAVTEVSGLIWLGFCIPNIVVQLFSSSFQLSAIIAMTLTVPICGLVAWLDMCGKKKHGLAIGFICSVSVWLSVMDVGV